MTWLIAYDIACPRRWRRVYRLVREYGVRLQWSVFLVTETPFRKERFLSSAARLIDPAKDDIRLYRVNATSAGGLAGRAAALPPPGVHWSALKSRTPRAT